VGVAVTVDVKVLVSRVVMVLLGVAVTE
jgi:hypothetical protein